MQPQVKSFMFVALLATSLLGAEVSSLISRDQFDALLKAGESFILKFSATWCGPCKQFASIFEQFAQKNPQIKCFAADFDTHRDLARFYNVRSVPSVLYFSHGKLTYRESGVQTLAHLKANATKYL